MILHLIRHPRPLIEPGVCYGQRDILAENAVVVAEQLAAQLPAGLPVFSSPLQRCRELAELLSASPLFDLRLMEMSFGDWEGRPWDAIPRAEIDAWAADITGYAPPGGESPLVVQQRALEFVAGLDVPEAVIVTHAGVIRTLLAHWQSCPADQWTSLVFDYGSCTRVHVRR